jgi:hypothetical protein
LAPETGECWLTGRAPISTEVELKLAARPADLAELKRALVAMTPGSVKAQERLISTYYDTQDLALKQRGLTLSKPTRHSSFGVVSRATCSTMTSRPLSTLATSVHS